MIDRELVLRGLEIAERIGSPVFLHIDAYSAGKTVVGMSVYGGNSVERVLPLVKRIKRTMTQCDGVVNGLAELDGIKIELPCIEHRKQETKQLPDIAAEGAGDA